MNDLERKLYRIIYNMSRFRKNPTMEDLKIKTGKDEQSIRKAVRNLITRKELAWDKEKKEWRFK
ncbi:WASH complex subunit 5 [Bacillus pumilus]|uniref:WASH complex subunit 5 n=1 Tax=Bacillus pumilus TaxID=1408 RepID=UPI0020B2E01B|nr:WASH complex subunit 5 [Bacillus pumilus]